MATGMNRQTGKIISGYEHLTQSIRDILLTPLQTRVMRRDYGCRIFDYIDGPVNEAMLTDIYMAVAQALDKWEPRFQLRKVVAETGAQQGSIILNLSGLWIEEGREILIEGIKI